MEHNKIGQLSAARRVAGELKPTKVAKRLSIGGLFFFVLLLFMPWQQTSVGYGHVIAFSPNERPQVLSAPVDGMILRWDAQEGQLIKKNSPVVELRDNDPMLLTRLESQLKAIEGQRNSLQLAVARSQQNLDRNRRLLADGIASQRDIDVAQIDLSKLEKDLADVEVKFNDVSTKLSQQRMQLVVSPITGTLARILAVVGGQLVKKGDPLAILVPDSDSRAVEIWVDGNDLPLVRKGSPVRLEFEGWPAIQLASGFPNAAVGTFKATVSIIEALGAADGRFRVIAVPEEGAEWPSNLELLQGVRVRAWIILNRVSLGYEIWRRFNGFPNLREGSELELRKRNFAPGDAQLIQGIKNLKPQKDRSETK